MKRQDDKIARLVDIARQYYEEDKTQSEIAAHYKISRPMVSKLLKEAKELGIVTVRIQNPSEPGDQEAFLERIHRALSLIHI